MPENLTRREFLKDMGLWGTVLGAGSALGAAMADQKVSKIERPNWIKEVDRPTVEIDWDQVKRFDSRNTVGSSFAKYLGGTDRVDALTKLRADNLSKWMKDGKPGYKLRDQAIAGAVRSYIPPLAKFIYDGDDIKTPEDLGVPRWEGTPEENAKMVSAAMRFFGAASVGFLELESATTRKLIYDVDSGNKKIEFEDVDLAYETEEKRVIPNKARWAIVYTIQMSEETWNRAPTPLGNMTASLGYDQKIGVQLRMQKFLKGIGYQGLGEQSLFNALGIAPAMGVMAGLGELSRLNRMVTPEYGPVVRTFKMVTDLPLAPTKPIDAGIMEFCKNCTKCADLCPSKALSFDPEPTWQVRGGWNNPGHKAYFEDSVKCRSYWMEVGTGCAICFSTCPFAKNNLAAYHRLRDSVKAATPIFDSTFRTLDDMLYSPVTELGKPQKDPESWWDLDLPEYGYDTSRAKSGV